MDLFDLIKVLLRRWYVVLPTALVALALAYYVQITVPPELEARGYLQWDLPEYDAAQNPISSELDPVSLSEGISVTSDASYSVGPLEGRYFIVSAAASNSEEAEGAINEVIVELESRLDTVLDAEGVPASERVELRMVGPEAAIEAQPDARFTASAQLFFHNFSVSRENPYRPDASTGRILQVAVSSDAGLRRFASLAGPDVAFQVGQEARDAAALTAVVVTGPDESRVLSAFDVVVALMNEDLAARQERAGVPPGERIALRPLDAPLDASDISPPVERAAIGIVGLGGLLALGLTLAVESISAHRTRSRRVTGTDSPEPTAQEAELQRQAVR